MANQLNGSYQSRFLSFSDICIDNLIFLPDEVSYRQVFVWRITMELYSRSEPSFSARIQPYFVSETGFFFEKKPHFYAWLRHVIRGSGRCGRHFSLNTDAAGTRIHGDIALVVPRLLTQEEDQGHGLAALFCLCYDERAAGAEGLSTRPDGDW